MLFKDFSQTFQIVGKKSSTKILIYSILLMFFEIFGVALIIPLMDILLTEDQKFLSKYEFLNLNIDKNTMINFGLLLFVSFFLVKTIFSIFINRTFLSLVFNLRSSIQKRLLNNFIHKDYDFHLKKNSSELINIIGNEVNIFCGAAFLPLTNLLTESLVTIGLLALMIWYEPIGFIYIFTSLLIPIFFFL